MIESFDGKVTIRVRFRSRPEYEKFRKYILKTEWSYSLDYPEWEEMTKEFHSTDDLDDITTEIVGLLQFGFEVYCCRYQLDRHLAEEEHPPEGDIDEDYDDIDLKKICNDLWRAVGGKKR